MENVIWMQYKSRLDETFWTKYILESYFKMADVVLENRLASGMRPLK